MALWNENSVAPNKLFALIFIVRLISHLNFDYFMPIEMERLIRLLITAALKVAFRNPNASVRVPNCFQKLSLCAMEYEECNMQISWGLSRTSVLILVIR